MTRTQQITEQVCDRYGITGLLRPYDLETVLLEHPEYKRLNAVYRWSGTALRITTAAAGLFFLFWIVATITSLVLE